jgi:zinc transport system ATP-binding protein
VPVTLPATGAGPLIELTGGVIGYGGRPVVEADLVVRRGEVVAVVGANGSGKTTLVKGVLGLAELLDGDLRLFDQPANHVHQRFRLGYVPQRQTLGGPLTTTVAEVVTTGRLARKRRFQRLGREDRRAVLDAIATVGLADRAGAAVAELSGGQQRRTLVARALASEAQVLVLDEPLAGVDHDSAIDLAATLRELVAGGVTVVTVLHELGPLAPLITRVVWLDHGRVVYDGSPDPVRDDLHRHMDPDPHGGEDTPSGLGFER